MLLFITKFWQSLISNIHELKQETMIKKLYLKYYKNQKDEKIILKYIW